MVISWLLIGLITFVILGQMFFLGKYFSITQELFTNKIFANFATGAISYFALSFLVIFPFIWITSNVIYFAILFFIKDFFTIVFLIARREKFQGMHINIKALGFLILAAILIPILYQHVFLLFLKHGKTTAIDKYSLWEHFKNGIDKITYEKVDGTKYINFILMPIVSAGIYSIVAMFYLHFSKRNNIIDYSIALLITLGLIIVFNFGIDLINMFAIFVMLYMVYMSYNLIMFSRRRYGTMFGISVFVAWGIQPDLYWAMLTIALSTSLVYITLKKPKALLFSVQLFSPLVIASTLWMVDISATLAGSLAILSGIAYLSAFMFGRLRFIDQDTKLIDILNKIVFVVVFLTLITCSIVMGMHNNIGLSIMYEGNNLFDTFGSKTFEIIQNIIYYALVLVGCILMLGWAERKSKMVKGRLLGMMLFFILITGFNPAFQTILKSTDHQFGFTLIATVFTMPLLVWSGAKLRNTIMTIKK